MGAEIRRRALALGSVIAGSWLGALLGLAVVLLGRAVEGSVLDVAGVVAVAMAIAAVTDQLFDGPITRLVVAVVGSLLGGLVALLTGVPLANGLNSEIGGWFAGGAIGISIGVSVAVALGILAGLRLSRSYLGASQMVGAVIGATLGTALGGGLGVLLASLTTGSNQSQLGGLVPHADMIVEFVGPSLDVQAVWVAGLSVVGMMVGLLVGIGLGTGAATMVWVNCAPGQTRVSGSLAAIAGTAVATVWAMISVSLVLVGQFLLPLGLLGMLVDPILALLGIASSLAVAIFLPPLVLNLGRNDRHRQPTDSEKAERLAILTEVQAEGTKRRREGMRQSFGFLAGAGIGFSTGMIPALGWPGPLDPAWFVVRVAVFGGAGLFLGPLIGIRAVGSPDSRPEDNSDLRLMSVVDSVREGAYLGIGATLGSAVGTLVTMVAILVILDGRPTFIEASMATLAGIVICVALTEGCAGLLNRYWNRFRGQGSLDRWLLGRNRRPAAIAEPLTEVRACMARLEFRSAVRAAINVDASALSDRDGREFGIHMWAAAAGLLDGSLEELNAYDVALGVRRERASRAGASGRDLTLFADTLNDKVVALLKVGRYSAAIAACDELVALTSVADTGALREYLGLGLYNRGVAHAAQRERKAAKSDFQAAVSRCADGPVPLRRIAVLAHTQQSHLLLREGKYAAAVNAAERAVALTDVPLTTAFTSAAVGALAAQQEALFKDGRFADAASVGDRITALSTVGKRTDRADQAVAVLHLQGQAYERLGQTALAISAYESCGRWFASGGSASAAGIACEAALARGLVQVKIGAAARAMDAFLGIFALSASLDQPTEDFWDATACLNAARAAEALGAEEAVTALEEVVEVVGTRDQEARTRALLASVAVEIGDAWGRLGEVDPQIRCYHSVVSRYGHDPSSTVRAQAARALANKAVAMGAGSPGGVAAYEELLRLYAKDGSLALRPYVTQAREARAAP